MGSPSRCRRSNRKKTKVPSWPASDAVWIRLNEVVPSGRTPHNSPSRYARRASSDDTADAMAGYLWVQSNPVRVSSRTAPRSSRACIRYPSNLISCSHSDPSGGASTSLVSCGLIQSGSASASARLLPVSDRVTSASGAITQPWIAPLHLRLGGNRFDQARVIILDVSDARAHWPAGQLFRGKRRQQGLELRCVGGLLPEPDRPGLGFQDHRHAVVKRRAELIRAGRDDREAAYPLARRRAPVLPQAGQSHQPTVGERDRIGLFSGCGLLPFVKVVYRHEAAAALERLAERRP